MMNQNDSAEILSYYAAGGEAGRLDHGIGLIEFERTKVLLQRTLPPPPAVVYDVGGGAGRYAFWLAGLGYTVHLLELSPENVALARTAQAQTASEGGVQPLAAIEQADALYLPRPDESADVVLLMGPLYHLPDRSDRLQALHEAWRVLRPGGCLAAAAISRFGSTLWALSTYGANDALGEAAFWQMAQRELFDGQHIRPAGHSRFFTRAFFHLPGELHAEVEAAGFAPVRVCAVEGPGWIVPEFETIWADPARRAAILRTVEAVEEQPEIMGMSPHFLAVAQKPAGR